MCQQQFDEPEIYNPIQLALLEPARVPKHIAFIPDGNRRWARQKKLTTLEGYRCGADNLIHIVKSAKALGVKMVTFYSLSTENWSREPLEIQSLLWLINTYLTEQCQTMIDNGIRFQTIGDLSRFPQYLLNTIETTKKATEQCNEVEMILALNYGSRDEMCRAVKSILSDYETKKIDKSAITEDLISQYLDTAPWGDPDLLIRTSGEHRISNFLLWQISYSEIVVSNLLWPDFTSQKLFEAVLEFQRRDRRLGKI